MTDLQHPSYFHHELSSDRLQAVAGWLLEEWGATQDDHTRATDDAYTRGCTTFGRQKNRFLQEFLAARHPWLSLANGKSNDLVLMVGAVPCRFASDSVENPSKSAVLETHELQMPFAEFSRSGEPVRHCFVIDPGVGDEEARVVLSGYSASGQLVSRWESDRVRRLSVVSKPEELPRPVELDKPAISVKRAKPDEDEGDAQTAISGS